MNRHMWRFVFVIFVLASAHAVKTCEELNALTDSGSVWVVNQSGSRSTKALEAAFKGTGIKFVSSSTRCHGKTDFSSYGSFKPISLPNGDDIATVASIFKELSSRVLQLLPKKKKNKQTGLPLDITDKNFEDSIQRSDDAFLVAFVAPWCGHCQALKAEWDIAARTLAGSGVVIATVDATANEDLARRFGVQGYPTIKFFPPGVANKQDNQVEDYQFERTAAKIEQWALEQFEKRGGKVTLDIPEITSQEEFDEICEDKCALVFLPHILDGGKSERDIFIETIKAAQKDSRHIHFGWLQAGSQPTWESTYGLQFGFPAILYLRKHEDKKMGMHMVGGGFDKNSLSVFVSSVKSLGQFSEFGWPEIETTEKWNGEDLVVAEEDEDFDLDAFLNED